MLINKTTTLLLITLILLIGLLIRIKNLNNWGVYFYDEGQYIAEAIYVKDILSWSTNFVLNLPFSSEKAKFIEASVHSFNSIGEEAKTGRPIHNLIMALGAFLLPQSQNWGNYVIALFGVLNIGLTFILALVVTKSKKIALLSSIFLAFLPLHIFYSRLVMAEMDSQFFFLIALIFYVKRVETAKLVYWWLTSIFICLALITNGDRVAFLTPLVTEIFYYKNKAVKSLFIFSIVFITSIILVELPYHIAFLLTHNYNLYIPNPTYIEQQIWIYTRLSNFGTKLNFLSLLSYPYMLINTTGYLFFTLTIVGFFKSILAKNKAYTILVISVFITLLFQSIHSLQALRAISAILPLLAIGAAIGLLFLKKIIETEGLAGKYKPVLILLITFITILELAVNTLPLLNYNSPFTQLAFFLKNNHIKTIITTNDIVIKNYNPNLKTINYQNSIGIGKISKLEADPPEYIVTTIQKYTIPTKAINLSPDLDRTTEAIEKKCEPTLILPNLNSPLLIKLFAFEHNSRLDQTYSFIKKHTQKMDYLLVYNYKDCINKLSLIY